MTKNVDDFDQIISSGAFDKAEGKELPVKDQNGKVIGRGKFIVGWTLVPAVQSR